jgi:peptidoglycan/LPS O-acetylase OafA/YrhL
VITRAVSHRIDVLKGVAIVAVIVLHGLPDAARYDALASLHYWQAVPVFLFLMGFNGAGSFLRSGRTSLRELAGRDYWAKRVRRLGVPIGMAWIASLVLGALAGKLDEGPLLLAGVFPMSGPGNYFITLTVEFTVLAPLLYVLIRRAPWATLGAVFALELAYELLYRRVDPDGSGINYLYNSGIPRYATVCALGMVVALRPRLVRPTAPALVGAAAVGGAYLLWYGLARGDVDAFVSYSGPANALSAGYAGWLAVLALWALPSARLAFVARLGRASFHIFLAQMLWFALFTTQSAAALVCALAGSIVAGLAFEWLNTRVDVLLDEPITRSRKPSAVGR